MIGILEFRNCGIVGLVRAPATVRGLTNPIQFVNSKIKQYEI